MRAIAKHRHASAVSRVVTWAFVLALTSTSCLEAAPVKVQLVEGSVRGFLVLRTTDGKAIAHGELSQRPRGGLVESRLTLNFADGSVRDERATFSQKAVFRLEAYRLVQRGPSFPTNDISFDRRSGRFQARTQDKPGDEVKEASGKLEVGGLTGVLAALVGKDPPDLRYWLVSGEVPAFVRFEGAMYLNGPVWRLEFAPVEWPK